MVDTGLNSPAGAQFTVVANSLEADARAAGRVFAGSHPIGSQVPVRQEGGTAFVEIRNLEASEVLVFSNRP